MPNGGTERTDELNQARPKASVRFNLTEEGRSVTAARRAERHFRREDPIAESSVAENQGRWLIQIRVERRHKRRQEIENLKRRQNQPLSLATEQRGLQPDARRIFWRTKRL